MLSTIPITIKVIGQLIDLALGKVITRKYSNPSNLIVDIYIGKTLIKNTTIDLVTNMNILTKKKMDKLCLHGLLRQTPTILQMVDRSTIRPKGILDDIVIFIESWEYPAYVMVLKTKSSLSGSPLILRRPWLAKTNAYISHR